MDEERTLKNLLRLPVGDFIRGPGEDRENTDSDEDERTIMDAVMAVLSRYDDIVDPDGYVDLERLYQVKDLILPLERRLDDIAARQKHILEVVSGMAKLLELAASAGVVDGVGPDDLGKALPKLRLVDPTDAAE